MVRGYLRLLLTLCAGFALLGAAGAGVAAQDAAVAPHPSHIHSGTCEELGDVVYPLTDVTAVTPDAPAGSVEVGHSTIDVTLDELLASPFALNVHESAENVQNYIACGNVSGPVVDGLLLIPLQEQNESGYSGIAALASNDAGGTDVSVYLAPGLNGGDAVPVAAATPESVEVAEAVESQVEAEAPVAAQEVVVDIVDFMFMPQVLEIPAGTTVTWTNSDTSQHTATSEGNFDSGILAPGDSFSFTFEEAGTFDYICTLHPNMTGQIVVTAP